MLLLELKFTLTAAATGRRCCAMFKYVGSVRQRDSMRKPPSFALSGWSGTRLWLAMFGMGLTEERQVRRPDDERAHAGLGHDPSERDLRFAQAAALLRELFDAKWCVISYETLPKVSDFVISPGLQGPSSFSAHCHVSVRACANKQYTAAPPSASSLHHAGTSTALVSY